jgi:myosin heavy subunit
LNDNCGDELMDVWWNENMENYLEKFDEVENCLRAIECTSDQITKIWRCVAAILDISNFSFDFANSSEGLVAEVSQQHIQSHAASLLGIDSDSLCRLLTTREMFTGKETFEIRLNVSDAIDVRNAVCRVLYDRLFHKIVKIINTHINNDNNTDDLVSMKSIGVLDIFGFETFNVNGMDQLLINFANEALQNSFNRKLFQNELLIYKDEDIICNLTIDACPDNRGCMDIIASKGSPSIFSILNNISRSQKPLDEIFCETMHKQLIENSNHHYFCNVHAKDKKRKFIIRHSIGDITYSVAENGPLTWIDKNKDNIPDGIDDCMGKSTSSIVQSLFLSENTMTIPHNKSVKSLRRTTVVERFSQDISNLCAMLHLTSCNFIRCIKPNSISQPLHVEEKFVYDQIRALGLVQCCEVMKIGLPTRITFVELKEACKSVLNSNDSSVIASANDETLVFALMWALEIPDSTYYIGKTRVFFKVGQLETLDKILAGKFDPERVRSRLLKAITTRNEMNNEIEQLHSRVVQSEEAVKVNKEQFLQLQTHCKTVNSKIIPFSESIRQTKDNIDRVTSILEVSFHAVNTVTINSSAVASHVGYNSLKFTIGEVTNTLKETNGRYLNINATFMTTEAFYASGALQSVDVAVEDRVRELVAINTLQTEILSQEKIARQDASNCSDTFQGRVDDCDNSLSILKHRTKKNLNAIHEDIKALVNMDSDVNEYESQLRQLTVTINEIISSAEQVVRLCAKLREDISKMQEDIAVDEAEKERLREEAKQREEELLRAEFEEKKQFLVAEVFFLKCVNNTLCISGLILICIN